jgi:arginase
LVDAGVSSKPNPTMSDQPRAAAVSLIGVPYSHGERGVLLGRGPIVMLADDRVPARIRACGSEVDVQWVDKDDASLDERLAPGDLMTKYLVQNRLVAQMVLGACARGALPIVFSGDCNVSIGVLSGLRRDRIGVVWLDAHPDADTPDTSMTGLFDGMAVATIAGRCWQAWCQQIPGFRSVPEERLIMVGVHEPYAPEAQRPWQHDSRALGTVVDPPVIAQHGFTTALNTALDQLADEVEGVYLHVDLDVLEPSEAKACDHWTVTGGLSVAQVSETIASVRKRFDVLAATYTCFDPDVDPRMPAVIEDLVEALIQRPDHLG